MTALSPVFLFCQTCKISFRIWGHNKFTVRKQYVPKQHEEISPSLVLDRGYCYRRVSFIGTESCLLRPRKWWLSQFNPALMMLVTLQKWCRHSSQDYSYKNVFLFVLVRNTWKLVTLPNFTRSHMRTQWSYGKTLEKCWDFSILVYNCVDS